MCGCLAAGRAAWPSRRLQGIALLELLIALCIFSIGMLGLLSAQLAGKRAGFDALQRSIATGFARDILERIHANPAHVQAYRLGVVGESGEPLPEPVVDCDSSECTGAELASFDLWQWESRLRGGAGERAGSGSLLSPRACITGAGDEVEVVVSWLGLTPVGYPQSLPCAGEEDADGASLPRQRLSMVTRVAGPP